MKQLLSLIFTTLGWLILRFFRSIQSVMHRVITDSTHFITRARDFCVSLNTSVLRFDEKIADGIKSIFTQLGHLKKTFSWWYREKLLPRYNSKTTIPHQKISKTPTPSISLNLLFPMSYISKIFSHLTFNKIKKNSSVFFKKSLALLLFLRYSMLRKLLSK